MMNDDDDDGDGGRDKACVTLLGIFSATGMIEGAHVWDHKVMECLKKKYRIVGIGAMFEEEEEEEEEEADAREDSDDNHTARVTKKYNGSAAGTSRSMNQRHATPLPYTLMKEEVRLLYTLGVAKIICDRQRYSMESTSTLVTKDMVQEQVDTFYTNQIATLGRHKYHKSQLSEYMKAKAMAAKAGLPFDRKEPSHPVDVPSSGALLIPLSSLELPWYDSTKSDEVLAEWPRDDDSHQDELKWRVYHDLWLQGYSMLPGFKFGCDYLVYEGDPAKEHSIFMACAVPYRDLLNPTLHVVGPCRLSQDVRKKLMLCSINDQDHVEHVMITWDKWV